MHVQWMYICTYKVHRLLTGIAVLKDFLCVCERERERKNTREM